MSIDELNSEEKDKNFPIRLLTVIFSARICIDVHLTRETFGGKRATFSCQIHAALYSSLPRLFFAS